jgi:hypothetical protein
MKTAHPLKLDGLFFWANGQRSAIMDKDSALVYNPCWRQETHVRVQSKMHPEDRVLVAVMSRPQDFEIARDQGWYRVPEEKATHGVFFEYVAFYFTAAFGRQQWAIHYYARRLGHELVTRRDLLPHEPDHPRAAEPYYKLQLGPLQECEPPIVSLRWRRISFIHTTWDRFQAAEEINDLFAEGDEFVDRLYHALRETGMAPERQVPLREGGIEYVANLVLPCKEGLLAVGVTGDDTGPPGTLRFPAASVTADLGGCLRDIQEAVEERGGISPAPRPAEEEVGR